MSDDRIESGIETMTTSVERHDPRNKQDHQRGQAGGDGAFAQQPAIEALTNTD